MKKEILTSVIFVLLINFVYALEPCQSGGLTTSVYKDYQMVYRDENFIQINNIDLLKDVSQLKDLTCLQYMDATDRTVKGDIANLKNLKNLEVFSLYSNPDVYGDICSLAEATKLRSLKFAFDPNITGDISCLKGLTKLETFAMTHTQISGDLSVFANMPNLKAIYVSGTNVKGDICALSKLTNLEELGIADEYPGNPDIIGDLSCLDNLQKLKRVSIYNTGTTNCEQFTKSHPNIAQMGMTESGRPAGGGCSRESLKTLVDVAQKYERKIGKEVQTEVRGKPDYQPAASEDEKQYKEPDNRNFLTKFFDWLISLFRGIFHSSNKKTSTSVEELADKEIAGKSSDKPGPGGCKSQAECQTFCSKPENKEACSKFAPPESNEGREKGKGPSDVIPNLEKGGPGGCKTQAECQAYCSKPENREECSKFAPPD